MPRVHVFADEAGNFDFRSGPGASRYFILTVVVPADCEALTMELQRLRHQIAWDGHYHPGSFHANADPQPVRERVFAAIAKHDFRIDCLILEKRKAMPHLRASDERFYQHAWYYLMKYLTPQVTNRGDELLVVAASIGERKKRRAFYGGLQDVMKQVQLSNAELRTGMLTATGVYR